MYTEYVTLSIRHDCASRPGNGHPDPMCAAGVALSNTAEAGASSRAGIAASAGSRHAESVDVSGKLQLKPGQSVAVLNPPPGLVLPGLVAAATAADADAVVAFVVRQDDLGSAEQAVAAARADRLAWIGYPKGGQLGTDLNRDRLVAALAGHGVQPVRQVSIDGTWSALRFRPAKQ
jgi:hypothetical protein